MHILCIVIIPQIPGGKQKYNQKAQRAARNNCSLLERRFPCTKENLEYLSLYAYYTLSPE